MTSTDHVFICLSSITLYIIILYLFSLNITFLVKFMTSLRWSCCMCIEFECLCVCLLNIHPTELSDHSAWSADELITWVLGMSSYLMCWNGYGTVCIVCVMVTLRWVGWQKLTPCCIPQCVWWVVCDLIMYVIIMRWIDLVFALLMWAGFIANKVFEPSSNLYVLLKLNNYKLDGILCEV